MVLTEVERPVVRVEKTISCVVANDSPSPAYIELTRKERKGFGKVIRAEFVREAGRLGVPFPWLRAPHIPPSSGMIDEVLQEFGALGVTEKDRIVRVSEERVTRVMAVIHGFGPCLLRRMGYYELDYQPSCHRSEEIATVKQLLLIAKCIPVENRRSRARYQGYPNTSC